MISTPLNSSRLIRVAVVVWLTLISVGLVALALSLTRLDAQRRQGAPDAQIAELQTRALELEAFRASVEAAPATVTESDFQLMRDHWQQQWDTLDQRQQDLASATDLIALQSRLDALVQQINPAKPIVTKPRPRAAKPRAVSTAPTFQLLGMELRGGEPFLAIQPNGTTGLATVRLLQVGDAEGRWQLEALESRSALFRNGQQMQRLPLPQE
ncbi:hypothetical protein AO268_11455 [Pseudomonas sp. ICMP 8385]|uniref:hypothetical protein n=1 Tax=Pseudomonas sp. ICMP 8385 TaxID=1718920 RepID=UPI000C07FD5C|nr:hypothetical protein [Pseudomonas sp. ICMP 8385]PHN53586.1 hypothetical protein AO268_11455 [Pseudomonas sp. ICMP 8385]